MIFLKVEIKILKTLNIPLPTMNVRIFDPLVVKVITFLTKNFLFTFIACSVNSTCVAQAGFCLPSEDKEFSKPVRNWKYEIQSEVVGSLHDRALHCKSAF